MKKINTLDSLLTDSLKTIKKKTGFELAGIWDVWSRALPGDIVNNTKPEAFREHTLIVCVESSVWLQHIQFRKTEIMNDLNDEFGKNLVHDIKFKIGKII